MANIDPAPSWANIRRLEATDRNMAGPGGILNDPTTSIVARLNLLRDNDTTLGNSVAAVNSRQDATDAAISTIQGQVLTAPGTLSDLDHGEPISVTGDQFPDVLSINNSRGPVLALNESISDLAQRDEYLMARIDEISNLPKLSWFSPSNPIYIAHRGGAWMYPEETTEGYVASMLDGNIAQELDVHFLSDGSLAVMHDDTVDRVTTSTGLVSSFNTQQWESLAIDANDWHGSNFGNALTPPKFVDLLYLMKGRSIIVPEAKDTGTGQAIADSLISAGISKEQVIVQSFSVQALLPSKNAGYQTMILAATTGPIPDALSAGIQWAGINESASDQVISQWISSGFKVVCYTVSRRYRRDQLLDMGVCGFFSDDTEYTSSNSAFKLKDDFQSGTWMTGMIPANNSYSAIERGRFSAPNKWGWADNGFSWTLQGWMCPIIESSYSIFFDVTYDDDIAGWSSIFLSETDRPWRDSSTPFSEESKGWHFIQRNTTGQFQVYKRTASSTSSVNQFTGDPILAGQTIRYRIDINPVSITCNRMASDMVTISNSLVVNDPSMRGKYIHAGHRTSACRFSNIRIVHQG
ncbi:MAG: hypothetical protein [Caudoviricetes sp.]|nr:MAG: hypothetical protein [Caudoviricetes sp.]